MLNSYLDFYFEVIKKAYNSRYGNGNDVRFVNLWLFALFSNFILITSSGKHLEVISYAHLVSILYKLITSAKDTNALSIGFDHSRKRRRDEFTNNKNLEGKYHLRIMLKDVLSLAEQQEIATYRLGYKSTLTRSKDDAVIDKAAGSADARLKIDHLHWYVPRYTPSIQQQVMLSKQTLSKTPTELSYVERSVFMKEVNNQNL